MPAMVEDNVPDAVKLNDMYKQQNAGKSNEDPGGGYTNAYSAIYAYAKAMTAAGTTTDIKKLEAAMDALKLSDMPALSQAKYVPQGAGATLFDQNQAVVTKAVIVKWANGDPAKFKVFEGQ